MYHFPATGDYLLSATPYRVARPNGSDGLEMGFFFEGKPVGSTVIEGQLEGKTQEVKVKVTEGDHWVAVGFPRQFEGLPVLYGAKNPTKKPPVVGGRGGGRGGSGRGGFGAGG